MSRACPQLPDSLTRKIGDGGRDLQVLVLRLGAMGDLLRTLPAVRLLRRGLPRARLYWVLEDHWRVVLEAHSDLDGLVGLPRKSWDAWLRVPWRWPALLRSVREFRRGLRVVSPELVLDFHGNLRSGISAWLSGAPVRLGYDGHQQKEGNRRFTTHRVAAGDRRTPRLERNLDLIRALGLPDAPLPTCDLPLVAAGAARAEQVLRAANLAPLGFAVVSPGASVRQAYKQPPTSLLVDACLALAARGVTALLVYGPGEEGDARAVTHAAGPAAVLAPPTDLATLAALLSRAQVAVAGDSGPLHMACAVGCPVVGLYGPTDPQVNRPWGVPFRALAPAGRRYTGIKREDRRGGFDGLAAAAVRAAIDELLIETRALRGRQA